MTSPISAQSLIRQLSLEPISEGGYFRRTYCHQQQVDNPTGVTGKRELMSCIYFLLTQQMPLCHWHLNKSDIMHFHHLGGVLRYWLISPQGELTSHLVGYDEADETNQGEWQLMVPGGYWKAAELISGDYALVSEAVSPAFVADDMTIATSQDIAAQISPETAEWQEIAAFIQPSSS